MRFVVLLQATSAVTMDGLQIIRSPSSLFAMVAAEATSLALKALDTCREVDHLAQDVAAGNLEVQVGNDFAGIIELEDRRIDYRARLRRALEDDMTYVVRRTICVS